MSICTANNLTVFSQLVKVFDPNICYLFCQNYTINYWISKGADRKKLIMGIPLYGQAFTLKKPDNPGLNSPGAKGQAGEFTRAAGFLAYYEVSS